MFMHKAKSGDNQTVEVARGIRMLLGGRSKSEVVFLCIGTDRSTGDALGPLVGTSLQRKGYHVIGTIDNPTHAVNLEERLREARETGKFVIAIDACLGRVESVGDVNVMKGSIRPGAGVGKELGDVGDLGILGIVNVGGFMEYHVLQNTRLSLVMGIADSIVSAITRSVQNRKTNREVSLTC